MYRFSFYSILFILISILIFSCGEINTETTESSVADEKMSSNSKSKEVIGIQNSNGTTIQEVFGLKATGKTDSGFEYISYTNKRGDKPEAGQIASFNYYVYSGDKLINSSKRIGPSTLEIFAKDSPNQNRESPVLEGIKMIGVGDSISIFYPTNRLQRTPSELEGIPFIRYDVVLLKLMNPEDLEAYEAAKLKKTKAKGTRVAKQTKNILNRYKNGKLGKRLKKTISGLEYFIIKKGDGKKSEMGDQVTVHYHGILEDGTMFDNSYDTGRPFSFPIGQGRVIPGWDEGIALLEEGTKAIFFVPYEIAYGQAGKPPQIPEQAKLIFHVELLQVLKR